MSVQSQIDRIEQNVANTYSALEGVGADMPETRNSNNLPETVISIKAVRYDEQNLTPEQQAQARENIGAGLTEFALVDHDTTADELAALYENGVKFVAVDTTKNLVPNSIAQNGAVYNGCGYMSGYRLNSSGDIVSAQASVLTGFIPYTYGKTIEIAGGLTVASGGGQYIAAYDSAFQLIGVNYLNVLISNSGGTTVCDMNNIRTYTVKTANFGSEADKNMFASASYIRICLGPCIGNKMQVFIR